MPSSPLQFVNAQTPDATHPPIANSLRRCRKRRHAIGAALGQQRPGDAGHLVGKCHRHNLERFAGEKLREPRILLRLMARVSQYRAGSDHQNASQIAIAPFRDRPELLFAASGVFARTSPIQAAKSRPDPKTFGSGTVAAIAVAPITPIPGMVSNRWLASCERCCTMIRFSIDLIIVCTA